MRPGTERSLRQMLVPAVAVLACLVLATPAQANQAALAAPAADQLVARLAAAMTQDEKLAMVSGWPGRIASGPGTTRRTGVGYISGVPRLGIPGLSVSDGPAGVRVAAPTTALPAPIALAATFSPQAARDYGAVLGRDARARDQDVLFGPMLNTVRIPQAGRNFETLGEDPYLSGQLAAQEISGIQSQGTIATAKHFAENTQEQNRFGIDVRVDERTLNEIELRGFETAVQQGRPGAVMCAYPSVNGHYSCENRELLTRILRQRWGFDGFVVSDYAAVHSAGPSLTAGLDVEFLTPYFATLGPQLALGLVPQAALDRAVTAILTTMGRFGLLDRASPSGAPVVQRPVPAYDAPAGAAQAKALAQDGAVLLRNSGELLPLRAADPVALIGPTARLPLIGGGGSSRVIGDRGTQVSALDALAAAGVPARFSTGRDIEGVPVPAQSLSPPFAAPGQHGLLRTGPGPRATIDPNIDATGSRAFPAGSTPSWAGDVIAPVTGDYQFSVQTSGTYGLIFVDGKIVAFTGIPNLAPPLRTTTGGLTNASGTVRLSAGRHSVVMRTVKLPATGGLLDELTGPVQVRLAWVTPQQRAADLAAAVAAARSARTAVVFAYVEGEEGKDLDTLTLPNGQDELISAVAQANPRTVVVLNSGYPALMPWVRDVGAVLDVWYPGQEGGPAIADLLLGRAAPGGRLPVTFPAREQDTPVAGDPRRYPGVNNEQDFSEGVFTGYRWYDEQGLTPLFPFGFGLSYTTFGYRDLSVATGAGGVPVASLTVTNTGTRLGTAVPQVYAGRLPAPVPTPPRQLAGVVRLTLAPGESRRVDIPLDARSFSYWDAGTHDWVRPPGPVDVLAGDSSRSLPLHVTLR